MEGAPSLRPPRGGPTFIAAPLNPAHTFVPTLDNSSASPANPNGNSNTLSVAINTPPETFPYRSWPRHMFPTPYPSLPDLFRSITTSSERPTPPTDPIRIPLQPTLGSYLTPINSAQLRQLPPPYPPPSGVPSSRMHVPSFHHFSCISSGTSIHGLSRILLAHKASWLLAGSGMLLWSSGLVSKGSGVSWRSAALSWAGGHCPGGGLVLVIPQPKGKWGAGLMGLPVGVTGGVPGGLGCRVFAAIFPVTLVDLGNEHLVPVVGGLLECEVKDILDSLRQGAMEGESESIVVPASLIGFPFEPYNKGCEAFVVAHSEVEEILLCLCYSVKDTELTQEFLGESKPIGEHGVVGVKLE
ncbi:hypothetical protein E4T56_gene2694 [Termitomyces sp. T112]|nr:hypothetical protein E4T56_gene2694 [Termitomyces sp. T112]